MCIGRQRPAFFVQKLKLMMLNLMYCRSAADYVYITSHHITSHHITSHHITSHHITSHHITSHHITSHHITSHHITSHHTFQWKVVCKIQIQSTQYTLIYCTICKCIPRMQGPLTSFYVQSLPVVVTDRPPMYQLAMNFGRHSFH